MQPSKQAGLRMMSRVGRLFVVGAQGRDDSALRSVDGTQ